MSVDSPESPAFSCTGSDTPSQSRANDTRINDLSQQRSIDQVVQSASASNGNMHVLLIGINNYKYIKDQLFGAVGDTERMQALLIGRLGVDAQKITSLTDSNATRDNIIAAIQKLEVDDSIKKDDPILIYYSGHGGTIPTPIGWHADDDEIQCLMPHDCRTDDANGDVLTNVIPDRTLASLLHRVADSKGNNITVILDSCHSGSGTRSTNDDLIRGYSFDRDNKRPTIRPTYDAHIWGNSNATRASTLSAKFLNAGHRSHVVLAAAGAGESARESQDLPNRGYFTTSLIDVLTVAGLDKLTYEQLIRNVKIVDKYKDVQHPSCEGYHKNRILFNSKVTSRGGEFYPVYKNDNEDGSYTIEAGELHGSTVNSKFAVYSIANHDVPLGYLVVTSVRPLASDAKYVGPTFDVPEGALARRTTGTCSYKLLVHVEQHPSLEAILAMITNESKSTVTGQYSIELASLENATLKIVAEGIDSVAFYHLDKEVQRLGVPRLLTSAPSDVATVKRVLQAAAHFFAHFRKAPASGWLQDRVSVTLYELEATTDINDRLEFVMKPKNVVPRGADGSVVVKDQENATYGIELINKLTTDLYVWVYCFDLSTLTIREIYEPRAATADSNVDPPLRGAPKAGQGLPHAVPLNFGNGGGNELSFALRPGQTRDASVLHVIVTNKYVDLSGLRQEDPLEESVARASPSSRTGSRRIDGIWDVITIPIVQTSE